MSATLVPQKLLHQQTLTSIAKEEAVKLDKEGAVLKERTESLSERCAELQALKNEADQARMKAEEALAVSQAERKLVDDTVGRADALVGELRAERAALLTRATEAEAQLKAAQKQQQALEEGRAQLQESVSVEKIERRAAAEKAESLEAQLAELKASSGRHEQQATERISTLEAARDEATRERSRLQEQLSVALAERRLLDERSERAAAQSEADIAAVRAQLQSAEAKCEGVLEGKAAVEAEKTAMQTSVAVAQAERRMLQELANQLQQMLTSERAAHAEARLRLDATAAELGSRTHESEAARSGDKERVGVLEAEKAALSEKAARLDDQLKALHAEHSALTVERRQMDDTIRRQEAQITTLQLEKAASSSMEERFKEMQSQRDAAELERSQLQEEFAMANARHAGLEQAMRSAEAALKAAQHELELERGKERERDERCKEFQRQRDTVQRERARLTEQLSVATAEARAASEREHALFIRTTVLEQQVASAAARAVEFSDASGTSALGDDGAAPATLQQALDSLGQVNKKWAAASSVATTPGGISYVRATS